MQNGNIKTIMAFFLYFNTLNPHPMRLHDLEVFQTKQEEKHEAKQHAESLSSAWGFPDKVNRSREDHRPNEEHDCMWFPNAQL